MDCPKCKSPTNESLRECPSCGFDLGFPNVRAVNDEVETDTLSKMFNDARKQAFNRGLENEFADFSDCISKKSKVIVSMKPMQARNFLSDKRQLYINYDDLVGSSMRVPASFEDDSTRCMISGKLFGSYANKIAYGILSLDKRGLKNYGIVFLCLRDISISDRVSFLNENSYLCFNNCEKSGRKFPPRGHRSDWEHRNELAASKHEKDLKKGSDISDWSELLVKEGKDRQSDCFIEAHIYGKFNYYSIENILCENAGRSREEKNDIRFISENNKNICLIGSVS